MLLMSADIYMSYMRDQYPSWPSPLIDHKINVQISYFTLRCAQQVLLLYTQKHNNIIHSCISLIVSVVYFGNWLLHRVFGLHISLIFLQVYDHYPLLLQFLVDLVELLEVHLLYFLGNWRCLETHSADIPNSTEDNPVRCVHVLKELPHLSMRHWVIPHIFAILVNTTMSR